jgi:predicted metal-dependent hydrolase
VSSLLRRFLPPSPPRDAVPVSDRVTLDVALPDGRTVPVLRVRDARARRIKLLVSERGARLTVPRRASLREAERFLHEHLGWLAKQLERRAPTPPAQGLDFGSASSLPLRGEALPVRWQEGRLLRIERGSDGVVITRSPSARVASLRQALKEFYLAEARRDVGRWMPRYLPGLPRPPRLVRFRALRSLWGSLSPDDAVSLDLALVLGPPAAFEYVLVHELCHLIRADHSRAFWREVERRCPDWREHRAWFRGDGLGLKDELRRLTSTKA